MPPCAPGDAAIAGLVAQMLQTTATLTVMVDEMMRFRDAGHSAPDAPPVIEILGRLLCDVLPALLAVATLLSDVLFAVSAADPVILVSLVLLMATVALIACVVPTRRALRLDPIRALQCE